MPDLISDLEDFVDIDAGKAWLKYTIDGKNRHYTVAVDNDWADPETVSAVTWNRNSEYREGSDPGYTSGNPIPNANGIAVWKYESFARFDDELWHAHKGTSMAYCPVYDTVAIAAIHGSGGNLRITQRKRR